MCGNIGGAISPTLLAYLVKSYGWGIRFPWAAALCVTAAVLFLKIDTGKRIFSAGA